MLHRNILNTNFQNCLFSSFFSQVDGNAPTFVTKPTIRQDADGSTLIFHCSIFADPKPVVSWFHNGDKIQDNKKFQVCKYIFCFSDRSGYLPWLFEVMISWWSWETSWDCKWSPRSKIDLILGLGFHLFCVFLLYLKQE